jgi:peptidoglycan/LPS O-acetylase OafA/YrhL
MTHHPAEIDDIGPVTPAKVRALGFLGFVALWWVVVNQFSDHLGLSLGARSGLVAKGYLGADLYLIVLGFVLCGVWPVQSRVGWKTHGSLIWRRIALNYPLHLASMAVLATILLAGRIVGADFDAAQFKPRALPANLLLIHAWGVLPTVYWNFPSWLLSAEFVGLLAFPAFAWAGLKLDRPLLIVAASLLLFEVLFAFAASQAVLFTDMTAQIGALRTIPDFLLGAGLYGVYRRRRLPRAYALGLAVVAAAAIVLAASLRWSDMVTVPLFGALILGLTQAARDGGPALDWPPLLYLGRIAYSVYLVYLAVDIAYFHAVQRLVGRPAGGLAWMALIGVFPIILAAGALAYRFIERPLGGWLSARDPFASRDSARTAGVNS